MAIETSASFSFNGTDLAGSSYQVYVLNHDLPYLPPARVAQAELSGADGAVTQGANYGSFEVTLDCMCVGSSPSDVDTKLQAVATLLKNSETGEKAFVIGTNSGDTYQARLVSEIRPQRFLNGAAFTLTFLVSYPFAS